jgi:hypothetical protein
MAIPKTTLGEDLQMGSERNLGTSDRGTTLGRRLDATSPGPRLLGLLEETTLGRRLRTTSARTGSPETTRGRGLPRTGPAKLPSDGAC